MRKLLLSVVLGALSCNGALAQTTDSGQYAAKITNNTPGSWAGDIGFDRDTAKIPVTAGNVIVLTFSARSANATPSNFERVAFAFFQNANGTGFLGDFNTLEGAAVPRGWTRYTYQVTVPANATVANLAFRVAAGGSPSHSIVVDTISVKDLTAGGAELLPNGGLDTWTGAWPDGWRSFAVAPAVGEVARLEAEPVLANIFKVDAGTSASVAYLPWFDGDSIDNVHSTRGMAYNPHTGHLLVADRDTAAGDTVHILNAATGAELGTFNTTGIATPVNYTFSLNKVAVDGTGRVFIANLARQAGATSQEFRIYVYPSEAAAQTTPPTLAFSRTTSGVERFGDDMAVTGSGANTRIIVSSRNTDYMLHLVDPENDGTFVLSGAPLGAPGVAGPSNVAFDPDPTKFWYHQSGTTPDYDLLPFNVDNTSAGTGVPLYIGYPTGPFAVAQLETKTAVVAPAEAESRRTQNVRAIVYQLSGGQATAVAQTGSLERAGGWLSNGNGAGDVIIDAPGRRVFILATNNSISGWQLPQPSSSAHDWHLLE